MLFLRHLDCSRYSNNISSAIYTVSNILLWSGVRAPFVARAAAMSPTGLVPNTERNFGTRNLSDSYRKIFLIASPRCRVPPERDVMQAMAALMEPGARGPEGAVSKEVRR